MADASKKIFAVQESCIVFNDSVVPIENERWTAFLKLIGTGRTGASKLCRKHGKDNTETT